MVLNMREKNKEKQRLAKSYLPILSPIPSHGWNLAFKPMYLCWRIQLGGGSEIYKKVYILSIENATKFIYYLTLHAEENFHSAMLNVEL